MNGSFENFQFIEASPHIVPIVLDYFPISWIQHPIDAGANSDGDISVAVIAMSSVQVKQSINLCVQSSEVPPKDKTVSAINHGNQKA